MTKIRAVLFDLDGVLVEAKQWHFEALNKALVAYGYTPISNEDHLAHYDGLPTRKKLALLAKTRPIPESQFEDINALKQKFTIEITENKCVPTPHHIEAVSHLQKDGYQIAVCSNSVRASVDMLLDKTGLLHFFSFTLSNEDVKNPKPHPEIYVTAMQRFGRSPREVLILEDNFNGIQAARASGANVMEINEIGEVNYQNIINTIITIESL